MPKVYFDRWFSCLAKISFIATKRVDSMKHAWNLWAKALGEKTGATDRDADIVAAIRTIIVLVNFTTCFFIMSNIAGYWG
tara:strand:+ start:153 stop:392 length:240 start_codon:yes stop_codon:yes gene_type:complete